MRLPIELKIKANSLAAEARIIRKLEMRRSLEAAKRRKNHKEFGIQEAERQRIHEHRMHVLRPEARATNLAKGFIFGHEYGEIEQIARHKPNWQRVTQIVQKYASGTDMDFSAWLNRAQTYFDSAKERPVITTIRKEEKTA